MNPNAEVVLAAWVSSGTTRDGFRVSVNVIVKRGAPGDEEQVTQEIIRRWNAHTELRSACMVALDWLNHHGAAGAGSDDEAGLLELRRQLEGAACP